MRAHKLMVGSLVIVGILCALELALAPVQAAPEALPPRPDDTPTPTAIPEPSGIAKAIPEGAVIVLEVAFSDDWAGRGLAWQALWTVVEWQDVDGTWREVVGWQGGLDKVGGGLGWKVWWLEDGLLGCGPFRWVVYEHQNGAVMVTSEEFYLPSSIWQVTNVEVSLGR